MRRWLIVLAMVCLCPVGGDPAAAEGGKLAETVYDYLMKGEDDSDAQAARYIDSLPWDRKIVLAREIHERATAEGWFYHAHFWTTLCLRDALRQDEAAAFAELCRQIVDPQAPPEWREHVLNFFGPMCGYPFQDNRLAVQLDELCLTLVRSADEHDRVRSAAVFCRAYRLAVRAFRAYALSGHAEGGSLEVPYPAVHPDTLHRAWQAGFVNPLEKALAEETRLALSLVKNEKAAPVLRLSTAFTFFMVATWCRSDDLRAEVAKSVFEVYKLPPAAGWMSAVLLQTADLLVRGMERQDADLRRRIDEAARSEGVEFYL